MSPPTHLDLICEGHWAMRLVALRSDSFAAESEPLRLRLARAFSLARWHGLANLMTVSLTGRVLIEDTLQILNSSPDDSSALSGLAPQALEILRRFDSAEVRASAWERILGARGLTWTEQETFHYSFGSCWGAACSRCPITGVPLLLGEYYAGCDWNFGEAESAATLVSLGTERNRILAAGVAATEETMGYPVTVIFALQGDCLRILDSQPQKLTTLGAALESVQKLGTASFQAVDLERLRKRRDLFVPPTEKERLESVVEDVRVLVGGVAVGMPYFKEVAQGLDELGDVEIILFTRELRPGLSAFLRKIAGVAAERVDPSSHLAILLERDGIPLVSGVDLARARLGLSGVEWCTLDAENAQILCGRAELATRSPEEALLALVDLARQRSRLRVWANADTAPGAREARESGAEGIGLLRTEHLFTDTRWRTAVSELLKNGTLPLPVLRAMVVYQRDALSEVLRSMSGLPVAVRLLDAPINEFAEPASEVSEENPMMGFRGVRALLAHPVLLELQCRAIGEAAAASRGIGLPRITVPMASSVREFALLLERIKGNSSWGCDSVPVGVMLETPRACLEAAGFVREGAAFASFGTNDLTQFAFGLSRADAHSTVATYARLGLLDADPFVSLDRQGVGRLIQNAIEEMREVDPALVVSVCGQHAVAPDAIDFFHRLGVTAISGASASIPGMWIAAARAVYRGSFL